MSSASSSKDKKWAVPAALAAGAFLGIVGYKFCWESEFRLKRRLTRKQEKRRREHPVRVWLDGCFDLMHLGHANAFRQAKMLGDYVIVGINPDKDVIHYKGGPPILNEKHRAAAVRACKWVDEVVENVPYVMNEEYLNYIFKEYKVDFVVHGDDVCLSPEGKDVYADAKRMKKFKTIKRTEGVSTTDFVGRMLMRNSCEHHQHVLDSDGLVSREPQLRSEDITSSGGSSFLASTLRLMSFFDSAKKPQPGDSVVYVDGDWDMFNVSHSNYLKECRKLGTFLIVGVHSDVVVNAQKGSNFPIMNVYERVFSVLSCQYVDDVIIGAPYTLTRDLLVSLNIQVVCVPAGHADCKETNSRLEAAEQEGKLRSVSFEKTVTVETIIQSVTEQQQRLQKKVDKKKISDGAYLKTKAYVAEL